MFEIFYKLSVSDLKACADVCLCWKEFISTYFDVSNSSPSEHVHEKSEVELRNNHCPSYTDDSLICSSFLDKERKHAVTNRTSVVLDTTVRPPSLLVNVDSTETLCTQKSDTSARNVSESSSVEVNDYVTPDDGISNSLGDEIKIEDAFKSLDKVLFDHEKVNVSECIDENRVSVLVLDHIVLKRGSLAVQKLLWSTVPYEKIDFGYVQIEDNEEGEELEDFWKAIGSTVTHANFSEARHAPHPIKVFTIIPNFTNLTTLEVDYKSQIYPLKPASYTDILLPASLSSLVLHRLMADNLEYYNNFINILPSSCLIHIKSAVDVNHDEDNYLKLIKKGAKRIKDLGSELLTLLLNTYKGVLVSQTIKFQLDSIEVDLAELEATNHLNLMIKLNPDVKQLKLKNCVTFMNYSQLTHLHVNFAQDVKTFKLLQSLINLQSYEFEFQNPRWKCFFGHETLELTSLRHLGATTEKQCIQCWLSLLQSCRLDSFTLVSNSENLLKVSPYITEHQNQLKALRYICMNDQLTRREIPNQELLHIFNHIESPLVNLQELTLKNMIYNLEFGNKICNVMNNLAKLELDGSFTECDKIFKVVMSQLCKLQTLAIHKYEQTSNHLHKVDFFDTISTSCCKQNLKVIDFC